MINEAGKDLASPRPASLALPRTPVMQFGEARRILQAVVLTHESTISLNTPLEAVAGFSTEQIRKAAALVGISVILTHRGNSVFDITTARKFTPSGEATLNMARRFTPEGLPMEEYQRLYLGLSEGDRFLIESDFPLHEPIDDFERVNVGFRDFRNGTHLSLYEISSRGQFSLDDYRHLFRGVRWMFANMLEWDKPGFIMPEQLDRMALS